jgi:hypothetical protein
MKKLLLLGCLFYGLLLSCTKPHDENGVFIRVVNQIDQKLTDISVFSASSDQMAEEERWYGSVAPGTASLYQQHQKVDAVPLVEFTVENIGLFEVRGVRCPSGFLEPGRYSLVISGDAVYPTLTFIKD